MATVGSTALTLSDWAKSVDPDGKTDKIVEILAEKNEILEDMLFVEGNLPTGHRTTVRTGLPQAYWRMINQGVPKAKSRTKQVTEATGVLEVYSEVDKKLADLNNNTSQFRMSEDKGFIEGMSQQMAAAVVYGNTETDPERILGLEPRFDDLSAENASQIIVGGGTTASVNTSIWLVGWGGDKVHGIFPKGTKAGLQMDDMGQQTLQDSDGNQYEGYRSHYQWDTGLVVRDWRYVVRIPNINIASLVADAATGANLLNLMVQALEQIWDLSGPTSFYCNRTVRSWLRLQTINHNNVRLRMEDVAGKQTLMFGEVPVRRVDQIVNTEALVA